MTDANRERTMTDSTFFEGLVLWLGGFALLGLLAVGAFLFLGVSQYQPSMDEFHVHNGDDANHTVRMAVSPANGSATTVERTLRLARDERRSVAAPTQFGRAYRLVVAVDDRPPESFDVTGPDDRCTIEVAVAENATVETVTSCA